MDVMNFARCPEEGPWDATRGSHQEATDPGWQAGVGEVPLSGCSWSNTAQLCLYLRAGVGAGGDPGPTEKASFENGHFRHC